MTTNELKVLEIIWNWGGEISVDIIAREAGISINYAKLLCKSLARENCIDFLHFKLCKIKTKGKTALAGRQGQTPKKIVISEKPSKFDLGKDKRERFILNYG